MKRYDTYKDSGVQWIGEIPSHWDVCRLKNHSHIVLGKMLMSNPPKGEEHLYTLEKYLKSRNVGWLQLFANEDEVEEMWFNKADKKIYELNDGDIVMNEGGDVGKVGLWKPQSYKCYIQNSINKITPNHTIHSLYLTYLLFSIAKTNYFWSIVSPVSIAHLTKEKLSSTPIVVPPLAEQVAIAAWLDAKCGEIDKVIATQQRRIELLQELRQSIITRAVTRGINPDAPLRPSGIDWIGDVPKHWKICAFKRNIKINNGRDYKEYLDNEIYPVMGSGGCFAHCSKYLYDGEAVLLGRKGTIDKPLYIKGKFWAVDTMFYAIPNKKLICKFAYYMALTFPFDYYSTSTALPSMTQTDLGNNPVAIPPLEEQHEILNYIERETGKVDVAIARAEREIALLQELRQSVITEVVTGKRKVC